MMGNEQEEVRLLLARMFTLAHTLSFAALGVTRLA